MYVNEIYSVANPSSWGVLVPIYLALIGISSGSAIIASLMALSGKTDQRFRILTAVSLASIVLAPIALVMDLAQPMRFLSVLNPLSFNPQSPMSWGSLILVAFGLLAAAVFAMAFFRKGARAAGSGDAPLVSVPKAVSALYLIFGLMLAVYPGFELGVVRSNPLLSSHLMPFIFASSGILAGFGVAAIASALPSEGREAGPSASKVGAGVLAAGSAVLALLLGWTLSSAIAGSAASAAALWGSPLFSVGGVVVGIAAPMALQAALRTKHSRAVSLLAGSLILFGTIALRFSVMSVVFPF